MKTELMNRYEEETGVEVNVDVGYGLLGYYRLYDNVYVEWLEAQLTWRDATTLPAKDEVVLAKCVGENGYEVVVRAEYYRQYQELAEGNGEEFDTIELCPDDDEWYLKEGWYELIQNWSEYSSLYIDMLVEKWLPIPKE